MAVTVWTPDKRVQLADACRDDWPRLMYDGFGIMVSQEQEEAYLRLGKPGPRTRGEHKVNWLSGGQRGGKTVFAFGCHADAALYKRGLDNTERRYWANYQYGTLAIAPTTELTLRLWSICDEIGKGSSPAQWSRKTRQSRGGAFIGKFTAGKQDQWPIVRFSNGSRIDFRSSEGYAYRLEGGQWWFITWDEWASQPDREIRRVLKDVLLGRARDWDSKIMPMAWPKDKTEHHLLAVIRDIESGRDRDSQVIYLDAAKAPWTNKKALDVELRTKNEAEISRTIKGIPAGGASLEFKRWMVDNMVKQDLPVSDPPDHEHYAYFSSWDLGLANDSTVGHTFRIPVIGGRRVVSPQFKARVVNTIELPGGPTLAPDTITFNITRESVFYRAEAAVDATGMGGLMAVRQLRDMTPKPYEFKSRSNDRIWGNMRLAAITNALDMLSWGRPEVDNGQPWGLIECPNIIELIDQLANFDRDATEIADDWAWSFMIGLWYIRRFWVVGQSGAAVPVDFDMRGAQSDAVIRQRPGRPRARLISPTPGPAVAPSGRRFVYPRVRDA
jgi:hypothetical protein